MPRKKSKRKTRKKSKRKTRKKSRRKAKGGAKSKKEYYNIDGVEFYVKDGKYKNSDGSKMSPEEGERLKKNLKVKSGTYSRGKGVYYVDSIYYLWFCFLKISEEYNEICDNKGHSNKLKNTVYKDFADVRKYTFKYWWNEKINKKGLIRGELQN